MLKEIIDTKNELCNKFKDDIKNTHNNFETENNLLKDLNSTLQLNNKLLIEKSDNLQVKLDEFKNKDNLLENIQIKNRTISYANVLIDNTYYK